MKRPIQLANRAVSLVRRKIAESSVPADFHIASRCVCPVVFGTPVRRLASVTATAPSMDSIPPAPSLYMFNTSTESKKGSTRDLVERYKALAKDGKLTVDAGQLQLASELERLRSELLSFWSSPPNSTSAKEPPKGVYIFGTVGTGKTLLTELLVNSLPKDRAARWHFHEFMAAIHRRLFLFRQQEKLKGPSAGTVDTVELVAKSFLQPRTHHLASPTHLPDSTIDGFLLVLDEFHLTDPADALLLLRILKFLQSHRAVLLTTSNRPPSGLYENGLNRKQVLKGLDEVQWKVVGMEGRDWRTFTAEQQRDGATELPVVNPAVGALLPVLGQIHGSLESLLERLQPLKPRKVGPVDVPIAIHGRWFPVPHVVEAEGLRAAAVPWSEIVGGFRAASDYEALCSYLLEDSDNNAGAETRHPPLIAVVGSPYPIRVTNDPGGLDLVRRFVVLLDMAYEMGVRVVVIPQDPKSVSSNNEVDALKGLFTVEDQPAESKESLEIVVKSGGGASSGWMTTYMDGGGTEWSATGLEDASMARGGAGERDVGFSVARARSRMLEMGGWSWGWRRVSKLD